MGDVMKIVVLRDRAEGNIDDLLLVMNYDEKFDGIAEQVALKYYTPDSDGFAACESIALSDYLITGVAEAGYFCAVVPWTCIDV